MLDPGFGYSGQPKVIVDRPKRLRTKRNKKFQGASSEPSSEPEPRAVKAVADLEYEITGLEIVEGGNGYVKTEPPRIRITPPEEDPDWFLTVQDRPELRMVPVTLNEERSIRAKVAELEFPDGRVAFPPPPTMTTSTGALASQNILRRLNRDKLAMLPPSIRPQLAQNGKTGGKPVYSIPMLTVIPQSGEDIAPRYRAFDPVFGGIGTIPVQKGATELKAR